MKCPHCNFERNEAFTFCPQCGKPSTQAQEPIVPCPTPHVLALVQDNLFFILCILLTVSVGASFLSGGLNVLILLITIFTWLVYSNGKKDIVSHKHIQVISGTVYAIYIINNILALFIAFLGALYTAIIIGIPLLGGLNIQELITEEIGPELMLSGAILALISSIAVFLGGFLIMIAIIMLIFNLFGRKRIHRFIKSTYKNAANGKEEFVGVNGVQIWLIIFAAVEILAATSSLSSGYVFTFVSDGCYATSLILLSILVNKHFCDK